MCREFTRRGECEYQITARNRLGANVAGVVAFLAEGLRYCQRGSIRSCLEKERTSTASGVLIAKKAGQQEKNQKLSSREGPGKSITILAANWEM